MTNHRASLVPCFRPLAFLLLFVFFEHSIMHAVASDESMQLLSTFDDVDKIGECAEDKTRAPTCRACASLSSDLPLPVEECCTDDDAFAICEQCLANPWGCMEYIAKLEADVMDVTDADDGYDADDSDLDSGEVFSAGLGEDETDGFDGGYSDELYASNPLISKRFGTLFLGKRPLYFTPNRMMQAEVMKRGSDDTDMDSLDIGDLDKRWGTLGIGSYGRYARRWWLPQKRDDSLDTEKRWGSLGIGNGKRWGSLGIGKRWGTLGMGKRWGTLGMGKRWGTLGIGKRWGTLGMGKRWGTLGIGKRWGTLGLGKRWGTLGLGKRWGTLGLGKRWGSLGMGGSWRPMGVDKRWGSLGIGNWKRFGSRRLGKRSVTQEGAPGEVDQSDIPMTDKRWGSLGIGSGRLGKRWGSLGLGNWRKRWGSLGIGKRWGSLGIGKRWGSLGIGKRWGSLGIGKRWGSLGIGNWKRWGTLGFGKRSDSEESMDATADQKPNEDSLSDLVGGMKKRWGTLNFGKRWGTLGGVDGEKSEVSDGQKRWGTLSLGKKWGTLGGFNGKRSDDGPQEDTPASAEKKWGSLGLNGKRDEEKRWGTLNFGKKSDPTESKVDDSETDPEEKRWGTLYLRGKKSSPP